MVDQLDLCVELLADVSRTAVQDDNGKCILFVIERTRHRDDPGPSYSLFYEDTEIGRIANMDFLLSVILGAKLNAARTGVCLGVDNDTFKALVVEKCTAMSDCVRTHPFTNFVMLRL
mgnify:CR=1 FL=1